jgi:probable phosphoglycerate mutase
MIRLPELKNEYYVMRHGRAKSNEEKFIAARAENDGGLVTLGFDQAEKSSKDSGFGSDIVIVSSPLPRARQTAEVLQGVTGADTVVVDSRLRERGFGDLEMQSTDLYNEVWDRDSKSATHTYRGAESLCSVANREMKALQGLESVMAGRVIVLVGHADPLNILKAAPWGQPLRSHRKALSIENAEIQPLTATLKF